MPEIGRPVSPQQQQYQAVTIGPRQRVGTQGAERERTNEEIINAATGYKPKALHSDKPHNQMGKDEFLKLLTYQLQNQDPMNPMDQSKMTGELAQFSQLEQLSNLNAKFDAQNKNQMIQDKFFAASFVGKQVVTSGSSIKLNEPGESANVLFKLEAPAAKVVVRILDEKNQMVGEIWRDGMSQGSHELTWDGMMLDNQPAAKGNYRVSVKAWDQNSMDVPTKTQATGTVSSVNFEDGEPVLTVDGQKVYLRDVAMFQNPQGVMEVNPRAGMNLQNMPTAQQQQVGLRLQNAGNPAPSMNPQQAANAYQGSEKGIYD